MKIAVINSGSSSIKFKLFDMDTKKVLKSILIEHIVVCFRFAETYNGEAEP
jgi:acetate kinase